MEKLIDIASRVKMILPKVQPLKKSFLLLDSHIIGQRTPVTPSKLKEEYIKVELISSKLDFFGIGRALKESPLSLYVNKTRMPKRTIAILEKGTMIEFVATMPLVEKIVTAKAKTAIIITPQNLLIPIYSLSIAPPPEIIIIFPVKIKKVVR
jgi:hypothetical protein